MARRHYLILAAAAAVALVLAKSCGLSYVNPVPPPPPESPATGNPSGTTAPIPEVPPSPGDAASARARRGLWLLPPGDVTPSASPEHPWLDYIRKRDATLAAWRSTRVTKDLDTVAITDLPAAISTCTGLVLKLDPAVAASDTVLPFRWADAIAWDALRWSLNCTDFRFVVGTDGYLWVVPPYGRAVSEPEFAAELAQWETEAGLARGIYGKRVDGPSAELQGALQVKQRVQVVRRPLKEAVKELAALYDVRIEIPEFDPPGPGEPVSVLGDSMTLAEALDEVLVPLGLGWQAWGERIDIDRKDEVDRWRRIEQKRREALRVEKARQTELLAFRIKLDGSPLTAEQIAACAAQQAGIAFQVDPFLCLSAARWAAVEADLSLAEVLAALDSGGDCQYGLSKVRSVVAPYEEGKWTLLILTRPQEIPK